MDSTEAAAPAATTETPNSGTWQSPTARELLQQLKLGVDAQGAQADVERLAKAKEVIKNFEEQSERAYAGARWPDEPLLIEPSGARLLVQHGGNLSAVFTDPAFEKTVTEALRLDWYEQRIPDEDGGREEWIYPAETEEGRKELADMMAALNDALASEPEASTDAPGTESILNWAWRNEPGLFIAYQETFAHVGGEEARAETLTKLSEKADQYAQRKLQAAQEQANGITTMITLGRPDLVDIAGSTGLDTRLNEQNITPRLIAALETASAADSRYEAAALTNFQGPLEMVELWDDEALKPYSQPKVVLDKENSDLELSRALNEAVDDAMEQLGYETEGTFSETLIDEPAQESELNDFVPPGEEDLDIRHQLMVDAYEMRRDGFEALGMTESLELAGPPQTGDTLRLDQLRKKDGTAPGPGEANAYLMEPGDLKDPEPVIILGIKDWAQRGYRALPGTLRPDLGNHPKTQPVRSAAVTPGSVIITPEGDRQNVLSTRREGLNVKITFSSNINPSEQETLTVPSYRRLQIEQPAAGTTPRQQEPSDLQQDIRPEVIHTTLSSSPGLA